MSRETIVKFTLPLMSYKHGWSFNVTRVTYLDIGNNVHINCIKGKRYEFPNDIKL